MNTKNQIARTRKVVIGALLLAGVLFSSFGAGKLPIAKAYEAVTSDSIYQLHKQTQMQYEKILTTGSTTTSTEVPTVDEGTFELLKILLHDLLESNGYLLNPDSQLLYFQMVPDSPYVLLGYAITSRSQIPRHLEPNVAIAFFNGSWSVRVRDINKAGFNSWLQNISDSILSDDIKPLYAYQKLPDQNLPDVSSLSYTGHFLPWQNGIAHTVTQRPGERGHVGKEIGAWDWAMAIGTEIWASMAGTVRWAQDGNSAGTFTYQNNGWWCTSQSSPPNYIVINNDDGSASLYLHLMNGGIPDSLQGGNSPRVNRADLVRYSGNTGYVCTSGDASHPPSSTGGAHLHFQVETQSNTTWYTQSADVVFSDPGWSATQNNPVSGNVRSGGGGCSNPSPNSDQIGLYADDNYCGAYKILGIGEYSNPGAMGVANDSISSIKVGGNVKATLCKDDNYAGGCEDFTSDDTHLGDNSIGNDSVSSAKVSSRSSGNPLPSDYGLCAEEGQRCAFSGTAQIYYGANNQFVGPQTYTDGVDCNNNVFGDPASGVHKQCFIKGGRPLGSTFCANENGTCSFGSGNIATVYYGANGKYNTKAGVVSSIACNNSAFPPDPFSGVDKACYYVITGSNISTPSNPNPADNSTLARTSNTVLSWNTNGTSCTIHIWGGSIDISPSNNCSSLTLGNQRGGAYNWQVTASNTSGSASGPIWHFNVKPYAPATLSISGSSATQVTLNWILSSDDNSIDIDEYDIYQNGQYVGFVTKGISNYTISGLACDASYSFYVISKRQGVLSDASNTVSRGQLGCPPTMPSNLAISGATANSLALTWQDNSNNESGFKIYRWDYQNGVWEFYLYSQVGASITTFTDTQLSCGSDYFYQVSAYNAQGESDRAGWILGTTSPCPPSDFTKISPSNSATGQSLNPTLSWVASTGATSYEYCYDTTNDNACSTWTSNGTSTNKDLSGLSAGTTYYWHIRAINSSGTTYANGSSTAFWSFTTQSNTIACPTITNWKGEYWNNETLTGTPDLCRNDPVIDFEWVAGSPDPLILDDHFSARWTRTINFAGGFYTFDVFHDDGFRFYFDNSILFENWCSGCRQTDSYTWLVPAGNHEIKLETFDSGGWASANLTWAPYQAPTPAPSANFDAWPLSGTAPFTAAMHIIDMSNISSCSWDYGDGQTSTTCTQLHNHTYNNPGSYTVSLTVSGPGGSDSLTLQNYITVNPTVNPANTGLLNPSSNAAQTGGDKNGYEVNPINAYGNDSVFAVDNNSGTNTNTSCTNSGKDKHLFYNYGINLPGTAVIQGIEVQLDAKVDGASGAPKLCIQLSWNGGASWTTAKSTGTLSTGEQTFTLGGPANTWGHSWTSSQLSNANFRVRIIDVSSSTARDFSLDWIAVRVTYK